MASPAEQVVPPHVDTLVYPLLLHVTHSVDFLRPPVASGADRSRDGTDGAGAAPAWPMSRRYSYEPGRPDALPSAGGYGSGGAPPAGGYRQHGRVLL
jgi:hypothetical protein